MYRDDDLWDGDHDSRVRGTFDWSTTSPAFAIFRAIESLAEDPGERSWADEFTLYDHVDPEALDALVSDESRPLRSVSFAIGTYRVRFEDEELLVVDTDGR